MGQKTVMVQTNDTSQNYAKLHNSYLKCMGFVQDQIIASQTLFGGHMDVNF